jgi:LytR cell envelope-related transcriptional attenuator
MLAFAAAAVAVVVVAVAGLSGGSSTSSPRPAAQPGANAPAVVPGDVEVAVLNSTRTPGLAGNAAMTLANEGWNIGTVTNGPDQSLDVSRVEFTRGHALAASQIAAKLGIDTVRPVDTVTPVDDIFQRLAGPAADVIVVVGADRAR